MNLALTVAALLAAECPAQAPAPDPHWGAVSFPARDRELRGTLSFNRFTQFSKTGRPGDPSTRTFNEITETSGFNVGSVSFTDRLSFDSDWTGSVFLGAGFTSDQPTRFLQNDYVHKSLGLLEVPVGDRRRGVEVVSGAELNHWWHSTESLEEHNRWSFFAGAGLTTSTIYHEPFAHAGVEGFWSWTRTRFRLHHRVSAPRPSDAYDEVADFANVTQFEIAYVPTDHYSAGGYDSVWKQWFGNPEIGFAVTYDTGLFVDIADNPIDTWFASVSFEWATGLRFETWNDLANGTDWGPTFGLLVSFDLLTLWEAPLGN